MTRLPRTLLIALVVVLATSASVAAKRHKPSPETDKSLGPAQGAGHYFDGQDSTFEFHGCKKSDEQWFPTSLISDQPTTSPSTHRYVKFTVDPGGVPIFTWKAKSGYRICGVEVFAALANEQTRGSELLAWASYTSGPRDGSTAKDGKETIKVHTPKDLGTDDPDLKIFANKSLGMYGFQAVTVYVRKG